MKLKFKNGDIVEVPEGMTPEEAAEQYEAFIYAEHGYDPSITAESVARKGEEAAQQAGEQFIENDEGGWESGERAATFAGMKNLGQNLLQMATPEKYEEQLGVSDEGIKSHQKLTAPLRDKEKFSYISGEVLPTLAIPASKAKNLKSLPKTGKNLAAELVKRGRRMLPRATAEGAVFGAAVAGPEHRTAGATLGGALGTAGNVLGRTLSRAGRGAAPSGKAARAVQETVEQAPERLGMEQPFIPVSKATDLTGPGALSRFIYDKVLPHMPGASRMLQKQGIEALDTTYSNMIKQAYGKYADDVIEEFMKPGGRLDDALIKGEQLVKGDRGMAFTAPFRKVLMEAADGATGGTPTMKQIAAASAKLNKMQGSQAPLRKMADDLIKVFDEQATEEGFVVIRNKLYEVSDTLGVAPLSALGRLIASKPFQKALMGNTAWQRQFSELVRQGNVTGINQLAGRIMREAGISNVVGGDSELEESFNGS